MSGTFLIFGAGAIGTYLGGCLAGAGHQVIFLEREADLARLRSKGIQLEINGEKRTLTSIEFTADLSELAGREVDLGLLAVKTYHLDALLPVLAANRSHLPPLLCLQNGVESEFLLQDAVGEERIIPGTVTSAVDRLEKGHAILRKERGMALAGNHPRAREFTQIFQRAGIHCSYHPDAGSVKWSKLILNLLGNASSAILDLPPGEIFSDPDLYKMEIEGIRETLRVMKARGIQIIDLPGVPVRLLAGIIKGLPPGISRPILSRLVGGGRGEKMPSFHIDLYSGKGKSEVDQLNGAVVRAGEELKIPTPVNRLLTETLLGLIRGELPLDTFAKKPNLFLEQLKP